MLHDVILVLSGSCNNVAPRYFPTLDMLQHVAARRNRVAPKACNMLRPTMLRYVVESCDRLAGALKCWANNIGICGPEMWRSHQATWLSLSGAYVWWVLASAQHNAFRAQTLFLRAALCQKTRSVFSVSLLSNRCLHIKLSLKNNKIHL